ncbi:CPBP family intramembrane glutamic endopeptidase [Lacticaseibacillus rhamnosus]|uniref:CPBP family intramembrane glutamic endopeptidase n=1 Tax=Lacticaseibacillus rhamnosus TaxID=47715 RepID=UPI003B9DBAA6
MQILRSIIQIFGVIVGFLFYSLAELALVRSELTWGMVGAIAAFIIAFGALIAVLMVCYRRLYRQQSPLKVAHPVAVVLQGIGLLLLIQVTNSLIMQLTHAPLAANQSNLIKLVHTYPWGIKLLAVVGGPIVEEYLFRGLLMNSFGSLQKRSWQWVSVLVSAFAFGFAHVAGSRIDYNIFIYAALGAVLAWTYLRTRDMRYSIGLHILNNATILLV